MIQRKHPVSSLTDETSPPTRTWPSRVSATTADCGTDVSLENSLDHNIGPPSKRHQDLRFLPTVILWSVRTFAKLVRSSFAFSQVNRWEIVISGHTKFWEGVPGFLREPTARAKQCIPRGRRKNYVPCWDKECEILNHSFFRAPVGTDFHRAASSLLSRLEHKQERWEEDVKSTDFSHCSRKACRTINKLTGRSGHSSWASPVSANSMASKLMKNGAHRTRAASPLGSSTRSCATYGRFQHLRVTVYGEIAAALTHLRESLLDRIPSSWSLYSTPGRLSNHDFSISLLNACANSKFQLSGEEHW